MKDEATIDRRLILRTCMLGDAGTKYLMLCYADGTPLPMQTEVQFEQDAHSASVAVRFKVDGQMIGWADG